MKLLKYMLCASMCMSFGVAHAKWETLGIMEKPAVFENMEIYGFIYDSDKDIDNAAALGRLKIDDKHYSYRNYITPSDCVIGSGIVRTIYEDGSYYPTKFNLINPDEKVVNANVTMVCLMLSRENKFTKSDNLKVRKNISKYMEFFEKLGKIPQ